LPASLQSAMGVLLYAMFVAIVVPPARASGPVFAVVAIAATVSMLLAGLPGLAAGWRLILATCVAAGVGATLFPVVDAAPPPAGGRP